MGLLENTVKKYLQNIRENLAKRKKKSEMKGEHVYEKVIPSPGTSSDSRIEAAQVKHANRSLGNKTEQCLDDSLPDRSFDGDSGISEPSSLQKKPRKIQFGADLVHVFERESKQVPVSLHKVKYLETPSLQSAKIMVSRSSPKRGCLAYDTHYSEPCDLAETSSQYGLPVGRSKPPKPPRLRRKFNRTKVETPTDVKRNCIYLDSISSMSDDLEVALPFEELVEDETAYHENRQLPEADVSVDSSLYIKELHSALPEVESEPIYAQVTPRSSRNLEALKQLSSPQPIVPNISILCPGSATGTEVSKSNSVSNSDVQDFLSDATLSTFEEILEEESCPKDNMTHDFISNDIMNRKYFMLKKSRDVECTRMAQASKAIELIKLKKDKNWLEELVAERVLLETSERVKLVTQEIRESTYTSIPEPPLHKGTIRLSNIEYPFNEHLGESVKTEKHFTDFFLVTISHGTRMYLSEVITGEQGPLSFRHEYTFADVAPDFEIKVKLFCLRLRTSPEYFWERFSCSGCCRTSKIIYEDHLTRKYQEKTVLKTSFKLVAEVTLTRSQINESSSILKVNEEVFDKLVGIMEHQFKCENVDMTASLSGFLDVGSLVGERYYWERKWCTLKGPDLLIYNYPQDEAFRNPVEQINLKYCFGPIVTKVNSCPKRRCFHLKTGIPMKLNSGKPAATLRSKPNFLVQKFFFAASNMEDYILWTTEVEKLLKSMSYFKILAFDGEYEDC